MPIALSARALGVCLLLFTALLARPLDLVRDGQPLAGIWYAAPVADATSTSDLPAATELARVVKLMSGADLALQPVAAGEKPAIPQPAIVLGALAEQLGGKLGGQSRSRDGFRLQVLDGRLLILGEVSTVLMQGGQPTRTGTYHGAVTLLEQWGCGWYAPGFVGEVIPKKATLAVAAELNHAEFSDSVNRRFWYGGKNSGGPATLEWTSHNKAALDVGNWNHAWFGLVSPKDHFATHPEYFGVSRGVRAAKQLCTTHPEVVKIGAASLVKRMTESPNLTAYPAGPNDGGGLCECPECAKIDTPGYIEPSSGKPAASDRIFQYGNELAKITSQAHPSKDLGILIYSEYSRPPKKLETLHPNIFPMFAPIRRCRLHGPGHPGCYWAGLWAEEIADWGKRSPKMGFYIYNYNLADTLLPLAKVTYYKQLQKTMREAKATETAWIFETIDAWAVHAPHLWLSVRLAWNSQLDIDAEMARYFTEFYGAAAAPMRRYWTRLDEAYANSPTHTGSSYGQHQIWTPELLKASRADLDEAAKLAANPREVEAVAMANAGLGFAETWRRLWDGLVSADFLAAGQAQEELRSTIAGLVAKEDPCWVHERYTFGYYKRFVGETVTGGEKLLKDGGQILVKFPDKWRWRKDEAKVGVADGWFQPAFDDSQWGELATFSKSWDDQGLGTYYGEGWYRVSFEAPADLSGDLRLWFGGFDESVDVYLNGQSLGEKRGFARPAEYPEVAKHLKPGKGNVLAVRVAAGGLAEMGTGGLMMPVVLYRAAAPVTTPPKDPIKPTTGKGPEYEM